MERRQLSVAMCTYNGARFLPEQLDSIAGQTRIPDELVVCDDHSSDETAEILRVFGRKVPFTVRTEINKQNLGSTKNFEKAIGLCQGEIIALADQDDIWKPQKLAVLEKTLADHPEAGYVFSDAELVDASGEPLGSTLWKSVRFKGSVLRNFSGRRQVATLLRQCAATGATMAFRSFLKSIILPISPYCVHDYWISLLASCLGFYGVPVGTRLVSYRQHVGQQLGSHVLSILEKVRRCRQTGPIKYSNRTEAYVDLKVRLLAVGKAYPAVHTDLLEEKIVHCHRRVAARSARGSGKATRVFCEVLTGRYARFSNSWQSAVEDLLF